jgi:hypothetical protein
MIADFGILPIYVYLSIALAAFFTFILIRYTLVSTKSQKSATKFKTTFIEGNFFS